MNIKFKKINIDGTALNLFFANCLHIGQLICTKRYIYLGNICKLLANKFELLVPSIKDFYFIFKWFFNVILHKLILKLALFGLGWAQVYRSQLGLMP